MFCIKSFLWVTQGILVYTSHQRPLAAVRSWSLASWYYRYTRRFYSRGGVSVLVQESRRRPCPTSLVSGEKISRKYPTPVWGPEAIRGDGIENQLNCDHAVCRSTRFESESRQNHHDCYSTTAVCCSPFTCSLLTLANKCSGTRWDMHIFNFVVWICMHACSTQYKR